jgi:predicted component of type VI protein secretion system
VAAVVLLRRRNAPAPAMTPHRSLSGDAFGMLTVQQSISLQKGHIFELSGTVVRIGRGEDNDVVIPDAPVSRNHAELRRDKGVLMVFDLQTTYGTSVNNKKTEGAGLPLKNGDKLKLGTRTELTFTAILQPEAGMSDRTMDNIAETIMGVDSGMTISAEDLVPNSRPTTPDKTMPDRHQGGVDDHDKETKAHE